MARSSLIRKETRYAPLLNQFTNNDLKLPELLGSPMRLMETIHQKV